MTLAIAEALRPNKPTNKPVTFHLDKLFLNFYIWS